ncbi:UNVERIFIED_CONTAM: hypothetical protein FKN15_006584 [Acipenser sinensis]
MKNKTLAVLLTGDDDLDLLASLMEENEAAERGSLDCEEGAGDTDELDDLFDADNDGEEFDEGDRQEGEGEGVSEQVEDINTLFGDVEDLEEEEPVKEMTKKRQFSEENQEKSKQDLEAELRRMQEQMETLQKQLAVTQQALTSPLQKTPPNKQKQQPDKSTPITLKPNESKKLQDSPCFSSQLNSSGLLKSKQRTAREPKHPTTETKTPHQKSMGASPLSQPLRSSNKPNTALGSPPAAAVQSGTRGPTPSSSRVSDQDVAVERFSGLRLRRPRVSSTEMELKMSDRKMIRLSQLPEKLAREKLDESDWVTFGVVVNKYTPQSSSSGKTFSIWRLTDLRNLDVYVSLFLFGEVHKEHWKTDPGTVIGILNPNPMKPKEGSDGVCLSVDHPQKVLLMGEAQDFGTCRAKKKNGDPCTQIVNLNECQFCQYHVKAQYKKLSSKRSELQSSFSGKVPVGLNGKPVQTIQSISATQLLKQQKQQMLEARKKRSEDIQRRFLQNTGTPDCPVTPTPGRSALTSPRAAAEFPKDKKTVATPLTPKLGRGFADGDDVLFFDGSPPPVPKPHLSAAKLAALKKLRAKGAGISKEDPDGDKRKRLDTSIKDVAERVEKSLASPETKVETDETEPASKKRREQLEYLQSAEFQEILNAKSRHTGAVKEAEREIQERYFEPLVNKEQMEDKMRNIRELKCRAVTCKTEKKGPKIGAELLLTRGEEQPKFLNSFQ